MDRLVNINVYSPEARSPLSNLEKKQLYQERLQQEKEAGYSQLVDLCLISEYDAAKQLANSNPHWGYSVVNGEVIERI